MLKGCFIILIFLLTTKNSAGLELFLDLDVKILPGDQSTCGVLRCIEEGKEPRLTQITEMTVFKNNMDDNGRVRHTLASVSKRQPVVSTFWDSIKVDGTWGKQRTELNLYLTQRDDCRVAEFSCEVQFVDGLNQKRVGFALLGKKTVQPSSSHSSLEDACGTPTTGFTQFSSLLLQSSSTIQSSINQLQGRLEDKVHDLEHRLEDKLSALDISSKRITGQSEDQTAQDRIDESISSLNRIADRLHDILNNSQIAETIGTGEGKSLVPRTCERREGKYQMFIPKGSDVPYLCDVETEGGGWIVIQRRGTGDVDFYRTWSSYKDGFGSLGDDFWLGNDRIHALTSSGNYELMVSLRHGNRSAFAHYKTFSIGDEASNYILDVNGYYGTAGDSLSSHTNTSFSTYDRDNDRHTGHCARSHRGAWWYTKCHSSNLNGEWGATDYKGPRWSTMTGADPVDFSEMKIRRV